MQFQSNFTRSFSNLLNTGATVIRESQETFQTASNILETLNSFAGQLNFQNDSSSILFQEINFHLQVEDIDSDQFQIQQTFQPDLEDTDGLADIQANPMDTPLQGATVSLPGDLLSELGSTQAVESLRVLNVLLQTDALFVTAQPDDGEGLSVGNLILAASLFSSESNSENRPLTVDGLAESQSVIVRFNLTEVCALAHLFSINSNMTPLILFFRVSSTSA